MSEPIKKTALTTAEKSRIERNCAKAINLRRAKLVQNQFLSSNECVSCPENSIIKIQDTKYIDSGGGFLVEDNRNVTQDQNNKMPEIIPSAAYFESNNTPSSYQECLECGGRFSESFLLTNFSYAICDKCRDSEENHSLITRTDAKTEYLLKDCDFDKREPPLKFISRKNPHNPRWGEMKLYLHLQVRDRAMEVWGSEDELKKQHQNREIQRRIAKSKKYNKQLKQLRMEVRSSLYTKETKSTHTHEFGEEMYNAENDNFSHTCLVCQYSETFEKM